MAEAAMFLILNGATGVFLHDTIKQVPNAPWWIKTLMHTNFALAAFWFVMLVVRA